MKSTGVTEVLPLSWGHLSIARNRSAVTWRDSNGSSWEPTELSRLHLIKASEQILSSIPSAHTPHLRTSSLQVPWSTFRPQLAATSQTTTSVGNYILIEVSGPHVRSSTFRRFSRPSCSPRARNRLELFQTSPMEHCNNRQHDTRYGTVGLVYLSQTINKADLNQSGPLFAPIAPSVRRDFKNKQWPVILSAGHIG